MTDRLVVTREGDDSVSWEDIFNVPASSFLKNAYYRMNITRETDKDRLDKLMAEGYTEDTKQYLKKIGYWTRFETPDFSGTNESSEDETHNAIGTDESSGAAKGRDKTDVDEDAYVLYERKKSCSKPIEICPPEQEI